MEPIPLPDQSRRFRLTKAGLQPQDCTLHPDGTVTMTAGGQRWRSAFTFEQLQEDWADDDTITVEWDPAGPANPSGPAEPQPVTLFDLA